MKKHLLSTLAAVLFSFTLCAQDGDSKSSIFYNGSSYGFHWSWKKKATKAREAHWSGLGFAFSNWKGLEDVDLRLNRSYSVVWNFGSYTIPIDHHWLFTTGLGFDWSRYHFKGDMGLREKDRLTQFLPDSEGRSYRDSKFLAYYATIPLLLEYQTKAGHKTFFIYGGVEGMINLYSKSQVEIRTPEGIKKAHNKDLNVLPLNYRFTARIGFDGFSLFGYYQPNSPFEKGKGPDVQPYGMGVMLKF